MLRAGVDLIAVERVRAALARHGERFLNRVFTAQERADCAGQPASLAARFAAKEAAAKALGCGIGDVGWTEIEVVRGPRREPELRLHGAARRRAAEQGWRTWAVSLSHTQDQALAFVVAADDRPAEQPFLF
ncbi:MAG: holo-ACP synthase [Anaerolineales bacterium]|nr:holo-ACP synthase [Anaerolineales bacterium]